MLKQSKWRQEKRDLQVGDIVLRKDETAAGQTYKYAKVVRVHTSEDGKVPRSRMLQAAKQRKETGRLSSWHPRR